MYLFNANRPGHESTSCPARAQMWYFKLYESGELIRYLVPYGDGTKYGMRDVLSGTVYWNVGTGAFKAGGSIGICGGYDATELAGKTLADGYRVVGGKLVDFSVPGWRENGGVLEYRVKASAPNMGTVALDGTTGENVEKWFAYGSTNTLSLSIASMKSGWAFSSWSGDTATISAGIHSDSTVTLKVIGPTVFTAGFRDASDVYSDATIYLRGVMDANGDGKVQNGDLISALGERQPYTSMSIYNDAIVSNEWVSLPFRGGKRLLPTLYFPQRVEITNATLNAGKMWPSTVVMNGLTAKSGITSDNFSLVLRFRPDLKQLRTDYGWILNWGYANKASGFLVGVSGGETWTSTFVSGKVTNKVDYTNYALSFFKQGQGTQLLDFGGKYVRGGFWHDLAISVDKKNMKLRAVLSRAHWDTDLLPQLTAENASDVGGVNLWTREVAITADDALIFKPGANMIFGSESTFSGTSIYTNKGAVAGNYAKAFRGSIQKVATWNRALSFDEMKAAIADVRPDLMRVGVRDNQGEELRGGAVTEQDDREWTIPATLASGESTTVKFVTDKIGEDEANQVLRVFLTGSSASGTLRATLNGHDLGVQAAPAGGKAEWKVRPGKLLPVTSTLWGSTNVLVVTRTDAGTDALTLDALALGGSMQVGHKNSTYLEFAHENAGRQTHEVLNGNTYDIKRVYFGAIPSEAGKSSYTNMLFTFQIPVEFKNGNYRWRIGWKDHTGDQRHFPRWRLNGHDLGWSSPANSQYHTLALPGEWLSDGENTLEIFNNASFIKGNYYSLDYWRIEIVPFGGSLLIVR